MMKMYKYKEFAPQTYLNLTNGSVTFSVNGLLKWLITALNFLTNEDWSHDKLVSFIIDNNIDLIFANHNEINFAKNSHDKFKNEEDAKLGKVELINVKNLTKLIKLIDKTKKINIYKEIMFKGFYLNLDKGNLFFELKEFVRCFINKPYSATDYRKIHSDANDFEIFSKKNNINIESISSDNIQFIELPESVINCKGNDTLTPVDINTYTAGSVEVIDSAYLLKIWQILNQIDNSQNNKKEANQYEEINAGIIRNKNQDQKFYSITYTLEALNKRMAKPAIRIGKNSIRKQIRKLIDNDPNDYQKIELSSSQIEMNNKKWLAKNNREIYINETLFNTILDYNFAKNDDNYPISEPKFTEKFSLIDEFESHAFFKNNQEVKIDYNAFNAVETNFNYFKGKMQFYIDQKIKWLYQPANPASTGFANDKIVYIESKKYAINDLSLRKILKEKLPQELSNINKNSRKYWVQTTIPVSDLAKLDNELSNQINAIISSVEKSTKQIVTN